MKQLGFIDESKRMEKLSRLGDSLERLNQVVDWSMFASILNRALAKEHKGPGGRPPYNSVMLFKVLILQRIYNLSDDQTEYQINDRMSFMRVLGLTLGDNVPDAKTVWLFRDTLTKANVMPDLFDLFNQTLEAAHLITHTGSIVDATFVDAPRQRNTREENQTIKSGSVPEEWAGHKLCQKDTDARWTKKNNEIHFGYKNHAKVDVDSKLIAAYSATNASVHDSQELLGLLDDSDAVLYADIAYSGMPISEKLPDNIENRIHQKGYRNHPLNNAQKGYRNHPLNNAQKESNRLKSKVRVRVEHVFGFMTGSMHGLTLRCIGKLRADFNIGLTNLVYNLCRCEVLRRVNAVG